MARMSEAQSKKGVSTGNLSSGMETVAMEELSLVSIWRGKGSPEGEVRLWSLSDCS